MAKFLELTKNPAYGGGPVMINVDAIASIQSIDSNRQDIPSTIVRLISGEQFHVAELYDDVREMIEQL